MIVTIPVEPRNDISANALREKGMVPAVFYGPKQEATPIAIDGRKLEHAWREAGETTIVALTGVEGASETLIKDVQLHPTTGTIVHADFYVLQKGKKVELSVPLEFVGEAPAEKLGHIVVKTLHEVEIEVAPAEIPHTLEIDLSALSEVGDHITVGDIKLPKSATLKMDPEEIIASVTAVQEEVQEEAPAPAPEAAPQAEAPATE